MKKYIFNKRNLLLIFPLLFLMSTTSDNKSVTTNTIQQDTILIYQFDIRKEIAKPVWRITQQAIDEAHKLKADYILIRMNTYGGLVNIADSIRTKILYSKIPVMVFIDNQAISAGALISIACDSIYMRPGASIGASTVVSQTGEQVPDKYQSFMRSTMRATAEAHGKDTIITANDTIIKWRRDPKIAESMVDPVLEVEGVVESGQVLTFTAEEAIKNNYCEGLADDIPGVLRKAGIENYTIYEYTPTTTEKIIGFLISTVVQGILIVLIIGGIYFELQSPGIGFPLGIAVVAALLYFAPLYLEGFVQNWEIIAFILGLILLGVEIFVIPGFGVAGVSGIILLVIGLTMAMVDNMAFEFEGAGAVDQVLKSLLVVVISVVSSLLLSILLSKNVFTAQSFKLALGSTQDSKEGYISVDIHQKEMIGKTGKAQTDLRPSGRVLIDGELFDAKAEIGYIEKGDEIKVIRDETGQLYVIKK